MTGADVLYGVTMQESGVSKRVSVRFEDVSEDGHINSASSPPSCLILFACTCYSPVGISSLSSLRFPACIFAFSAPPTDRHARAELT